MITNTEYFTCFEHGYSFECLSICVCVCVCVFLEFTIGADDERDYDDNNASKTKTSDLSKKLPAT